MRYIHSKQNQSRFPRKQPLLYTGLLFIALTGGVLSWYGLTAEAGNVQGPGGPTTAPFVHDKYRFYENVDNIAVTTSLANTGVQATLTDTNQAFRLKTGVRSSGAVVQAVDLSCSLVDSRVFCWGLNSTGALGNNTTTASYVPTAVDTTGVLAGKTSTAVAGGTNFNCTIANSLLYCWGSGANGRLGNNSTANSLVPVAVDTTGVLSGKTILQISGGFNHACAVASDNNAYCWGLNSQGQLGDNSLTQRLVPVAVNTAGVLAGKTIKQLSAGGEHTCAIASDDLAYCWGFNTYGQLGDNSTTRRTVPVAVNTAGVLAGKTIKSIAAYNYSTCVIASDDQAYCWGRNDVGRLGNNNMPNNSSVPVAVYTAGVLAGKTIKYMSEGHGSVPCVVASDDQAYCWGAGTFYQLGNGVSGNSPVPVAVDTSGVLAGKTIKSITSRGNSVCAIASDDQLYCWGDNSSGELGNDLTSPGATPLASRSVGSDIPVSGNTYKLQVAQLSTVGCSTQSTGFADVTASSAGIAYSTNPSVADGSSISASALDPIPSDRSAPQNYVSSSTPFTNSTSIVSSKTGLWDFSLRDNNAPASTTYCLRIVYSDGSPLEQYQSFPQVVTASQVVKSQGPYRLYENADASSPGSPLATTNDAAQLSSLSDPFRVRLGVGAVMAGKTIKSVSAGNYHSCAIGSDDLAYCWGANWSGQVGDNSNDTYVKVPSAVDASGVLAGKTIKQLSAGGEHTCAIASDDQAYCWGNGGDGQLGNNSTADSSVPVAVDASGVLAGKTIKQLSAGGYHTCVIASDDNVYCWGNGGDGQLGNNSLTDSTVPVAVDTTGVLNGKTVKQLFLGDFHTCAIASDDQAYCWGWNGSGRLGNNSTTFSAVAVAVDTSGVLAGKTVKQLSAGDAHTCAIASDDQAYCWGYNGSGQLGNNSTSQSLVPIAVNTAGVLSGKTILSLGLGWGHTCAVASDNNVYCWGGNWSGQLGDNSTTDSLVPATVDTSGVLSGKTILSVSSGDDQTCVVGSDNQAYCWGEGGNGELGSNSFLDSLVPKAVGRALVAGADSYKLQFTQRTAGTCSAQTTGFADVTSSSLIAYNTNPSVADRSTIATTANDPTPNALTVPQLYVSSNATSFTTTDVPKSQVALFDFSLRDNSAPASTTYCLRLTYADGSPLEQGSSAFPEITTAVGVLSIDFVDAGGSPLASPTFDFTNTVVSTINSQSTTTTFAQSTKKLRVFNSLATNGWAVSLAPSAGPTAYWDRTDTLAKYDFNDATASAGDGADTDSLGGQLSVNPTLGTIASACSLTGLSLGSSANFVEGTNDNITLLQASSGAAMNCDWDFTGAELTQTIPGAQPAGTYTMGMTATVVAL